MKNLRTLLAAVAAALLVIPAPSFAQAPASSSATAARLPEAEKKFIKDFVEQHLLEQELVNRARGKETAAVRDNKPSPLTPAVSALYKKLFGELTASWTEFATLSQS